MMQTKPIALLPLLAAGTAQAHPALHQAGFFRNLAHFLSQPDHLALLGLAGLGGYLLLRRHPGRNR